MPDVVSLGELLIDFCAAEPDVSLAQAMTFTKAPGGAPANVAVAAARLGLRAGTTPDALDADELGRIVRRANAVGALATTKIGAIPSLPTAAEVEAFLAG